MDEPRGGDRPRAGDSPALQRVLATLDAADRPPSAAELARILSLHVTTVRSHLEQLERAGLVVRELEVSGRRGRPGFRYRATRRDPERAREELIGVLAAALAGPAGSGRDPALDAGRAWADQVAVVAADPASALITAFGELGFDPEPDGASIRLRSCPFRQAARANPEVVCRVHLGLAQRLAEQTGEAGIAVELHPFVEPELCIVDVLTSRS